MITTQKTKIRMLNGIAGGAMPGYGIQAEFSHLPGSVVEAHPDLAKAWVECGHAEMVQDTTKKGK